jgi:hypothetical protein
MDYKPRFVKNKKEPQRILKVTNANTFFDRVQKQYEPHEGYNSQASNN